MVSRAVGVVSRRPALFWLIRSDLPDEMDLREETGMMLPWDTDAGRKFFLLVLMMTLLSTPLWLLGEADAEVLVSELCGDPASDWDGDGSVDSRRSRQLLTRVRVDLQQIRRTLAATDQVHARASP